MKFARRRREEVSVNLTPLIDIVFLLLIFFMVSTTFTKESRLTLELPEASGDTSEGPNDYLEITVSAVGEYGINGKALANHNLQTLLKAIRLEAPEGVKIPVVLTADANAPHQAVVTAMDAAGQLGYVNLSITTMQPSDKQ